MRDLLYPELQHAWNYKPLPLSSNSDLKPPQVVAPLSFYDKHLDGRLVLKKVTIWPTLIPDLSIVVERVMQSLKDKSIVLPPFGDGDMIPRHGRRRETYTGSLTGGELVAKSYQIATSHFCGAIASTLLLSPRASRWESPLLWGFTLQPMLDKYKSAEEDFVLKLYEDTILSYDWDSVEEAARPALRYALDKSPELAHWEIFAICPEAEQLLRDMGEVAKDSDFLHDKCSTIGSPAPAHDDTLPYAPDAETSSWGASISSFGDKRHDAQPSSQPPDPRFPTPPEPPQRRSARNNTKTSDEAINPKRKSRLKAPGNQKSSDGDKEVNAHWPNVTIPGQPKEGGTEKGSIVHSLLQRAWTRLVRMDSTFIIFHCGGKYERIGFRHRASQTLFLSDLIDVSHDEDPAYGRLHTGLYISILHDILDRTAQKMKREAEIRPEKKRKREPAKSSGIDYKRPKTRGQALKAKAEQKKRQELQKLIGAEAATRDIVLVHMRFGGYNSPAPSAFVRSGQSPSRTEAIYTPDQYISLVVGSRIAAGATGIVHNATLDLALEGGKTIQSLNVAVKFAFEPPEKEKMRHEYSIYQHLAAAGVEGIPNTLGLFEDLEDDVLALVMTHVGTALATIHGYALKFIVPQPQHNAFVQIVEEIHKAGVRHRDIRPENLMMDDSGEVFVIDFDMAQMNPTDGAKKREIKHLKELLDGDYLPPNEFPSEITRDSESIFSSDIETETETETES